MGKIFDIILGIAFFLTSLWVSYLVFANDVEAQMLTIVHIQTPGAVKPKNVEEIYSRNSWYFSQLGVNFRHRIIRRTSDCQSFHSLQTRAQEVICFADQTLRDGIINVNSKRVQLVYFMTEPFYLLEDPEKLNPLIGGIAIALGGQVSTGNALVRTPYGEHRINHSANILAHEVCHLMTCVHILKLNLMHPSANDFTILYGNKLPVLYRTKHQVRRWAKTLGVRINS